MVQHTKAIHLGSKFHMSRRLMQVEPDLALLSGLQRELSYLDMRSHRGFPLFFFQLLPTNWPKDNQR